MAASDPVNRARRPSRYGGLTLVETMAVLLVLGILAATAVLVIGSTINNRATIAAKQLQRDLGYARQRALATGIRMWVVFDDSAGTWTVYEEDPDNPGRAGRSVVTDPARHDDFVQTLDSGSLRGVEIVSVDFDGGNEVGFDWLGEPLNDTEAALAAEGTVTLTGSHQVQVTAGRGAITYVAPQ